MKFGFRVPSLKKKLAARTSLKRVLRHSLGVKAGSGGGWLTNPKKAACNRVYGKTTQGCALVIAAAMALAVTASAVFAAFLAL